MSTSSDLSSAASTCSDTDAGSSTGTAAEGAIREMVILPKDFEPSNVDVIIGRGKAARTHKGNQRLKDLIHFYLPEYAAAGSNKDEKSYIIKEIVAEIRKSSPDGGFVKLNKAKENRWFEVGDFLAREKVSQTFRDAMGDSYSSSNPYKRKRRSFEKKHNAILDIIKNRRGCSPTSVVLQAGNSSPVSPSSPTLGGFGKIKTMSAAALQTTAVPSPTLPAASASPNHSSLLDKMFNSHPGQIGFARRMSMMQSGSGYGVMSSSMPMESMFQRRSSSLTPFHSIGGTTHTSNSSALNLLRLEQLRRSSLPTTPYTAAMMMNRQHINMMGF